MAESGLTKGRPFCKLRDSGLLWLINRVVFHPRGYALALHLDGEEATGWSLIGNGSEPWSFGEDEDDNFRAAEATLASLREADDDDPDVVAAVRHDQVVRRRRRT